MKLPRFCLDLFLDRFRFFLDTRPQGTAYQPLPWVGLGRARRATGTRERWQTIRAELARVGAATALDIGCNIGYFTFEMAQMDMLVVGVESERRSLRVANEVRRRLDLENVDLLDAYITPASISLLPTVDAVLLLSVWHHWVRCYGLEDATQMTKCLLSKATKMLFFDTGQSEMPASYGLPDMGDSDEDWLRSYLNDMAGGEGAVRKLGDFKAFGPGGGEHRGIVYRTLFVIERLPPKQGLQARDVK